MGFYAPHRERARASRTPVSEGSADANVPRGQDASHDFDDEYWDRPDLWVVEQWWFVPES